MKFLQVRIVSQNDDILTTLKVLRYFWLRSPIEALPQLPNNSTRSPFSNLDDCFSHV